MADEPKDGQGTKPKGNKPQAWRAERNLTQEERTAVLDTLGRIADLSAVRVIGETGTSAARCKAKMAEKGIGGAWEFVRFDHEDGASQVTVWGKPKR